MRRVGAGGVLEPLPRRLVVVEPVAAVPAVAVARDLRPRLDPGPVLRRRPDPRLRCDAAQLRVAAVVVDVGVRDDDVGDLGRRAAELGECRRDVLGDRPVDPGVDEQEPLVTDDEPLREAPAARGPTGSGRCAAGLPRCSRMASLSNIGSKLGTRTISEEREDVKTAERTRIAFERGTPDRVPFHCWLGLPLIKKLKPPEKRMLEMLEWLDRRPDGIDREDAAGPRARPDDHDVQPAHRRARDLAADALSAPVRDGHVGRDLRGHRRRATAGASTRTRSARPTATSTTRTGRRTASAPRATTSCSRATSRRRSFPRCGTSRRPTSTT